MEKTQQTEQSPEAHLKLVFATANYKVFVGRIPDLHETPKALTMRYLIVHTEDGVVYGIAGGRGNAIIAALQAQQELEKADDVVEELEARKAQSSSSLGDLDFPKLN